VMASPNDSNEGVGSTALSVDAGDGRSLPRYSLFFDVVGSDEGWAGWPILAHETIICLRNARLSCLN
jgi:hypothetical protein